MFQENKACQIFQKTNIFYPLIHTHLCAYQGVKNVCFFRKFGMLCFLEAPILRFALLPYYRQFKVTTEWLLIFSTLHSFLQSLFKRVLYEKKLFGGFAPTPKTLSWMPWGTYTSPQTPSCNCFWLGQKPMHSYFFSIIPW